MLFLKFKNDENYFSKITILLLFFISMLLGEETGLQKEYVLYACENDGKNGQPFINIC